MQQVCRVEDSAASCCDLLIAQSGNLVTELSVTSSGINDVSMAVTKSRHHVSALRVDEFNVGGCIGIQNRATPLAAGTSERLAKSPVDFCSEQTRDEVVGGVVFTTPTATTWPKLRDDTFFDDQVSILDALYSVHLRALKLPHI